MVILISSQCHLLVIAETSQHSVPCYSRMSEGCYSLSGLIGFLVISVTRSQALNFQSFTTVHGDFAEIQYFQDFKDCTFNVCCISLASVRVQKPTLNLCLALPGDENSQQFCTTCLWLVQAGETAPELHQDRGGDYRGNWEEGRTDLTLR